MDHAAHGAGGAPVAAAGGLSELFETIFANQTFMPHGHCYFWTPSLLWLHFSTDLLIGLAYVSISITLWWLVKRINLPFHSMFLAFGLFIAACGFTHFMAVWTIWVPNYWLSGFVKAVTAIASVATGMLLFPLMPRIESLVRSAELAEARRLELLEKNKKLEELYRHVQEADAARARFFANVSHELRTPLALILGPAERMHETASDERDRRDLEVIERNARTLLKHVNELLDVARLEAGKLAASFARIDLAQLVRIASAHFDGLAADRKIRLLREIPEGLEAEVDADKIERVVLNLLSNAFKFVPVGGTVRVRLTAEGGRAMVEVADSGPGVPVEKRQSIFQRFATGESAATRQYGGIGLGLAIAEEFVRLHGGSIEVGDAPEGGALFRFEVPLRASSDVAVAEAAEALAAPEVPVEVLVPTSAAEAAEQQAVGEGEALVLVVEDNPDLRRFVCETLQERYGVVVAADGAEGLEKALALRPDLVVSDVMMPRMGGDELLRQARQHRELDGTPFLLLTAKADEELRARMLREGAQDYLTKPFAVEELRARVGNLVAMKRTRDRLQQELASQLVDLEALAAEVGLRRRQLEEALEQAREARDRAEVADQAKSTFLGLCSHELRTPLTSIDFYLEALRRRGLDERQATVVEKIESSSRRLHGLIESLLEYVRVETERLVVVAEPIDLRALATDVLAGLEPEARARSLELRLESGALPTFHGDERIVRRILANLADNALRYTERGLVEVRLSREAELQRIEVRDTGPGIAPELLGRIFDPFVQLEPIEHKHEPGFGLGLSLVRRLVDALGGTIEVESVVGEGSRFVVLLPDASKR